MATSALNSFDKPKGDKIFNKMMSETYFDEQAGPVCPQASVDPANLTNPQSYVSHQNLYHFTNLLSQMYSIPSLNPNQTLCVDPSNQESLSIHIASQLQALYTLSPDMSPLLGVASNSPALHTHDGYSFDLDSYNNVPSPLSFSQPQRNLEAYCQVLNLMPFKDDEPIEKYNITADIESRITLNIQAETVDSTIDIAQVQTIPVKVTLAITPLEASYRPSLDLVCVIEKSQAMDHGFFNAICSSMHRLLSILNKKDRLSLIFYDDFGYRVTPLNCMTEENKEIIRESLHNVYLSGGVNLVDGLGQAMEVVRQRRSTNDKTSIFLMGASNDMKSLATLDFLFQKYASDSTFVHSFGCIDGVENVFQSMACKKNNFYHYIQNEDELNNSLSEALLSLFHISKQDSELYFIANSKLHPQTPDSDNFGWAIPDKCCKVKIPYSEELNQEFNFEIEIPRPVQSIPLQEQITVNILDVVYRVESLGGIVMKKESLQINVTGQVEEDQNITEQNPEDHYERGLFREERCKDRKQNQNRSTDSTEIVHRLVAVEQLMVQASWLLENNNIDEAKQVTASLRYQAQGLGMEFEGVIKSFLEEFYRKTTAITFDEFMESDF